MRSEWMVGTRYHAGEYFTVYRLKDVRIVDCKKNRDYAERWIKDRDTARTLASILNRIDLLQDMSTARARQIVLEALAAMDAEKVMQGVGAEGVKK